MRVLIKTARDTYTSWEAWNEAQRAKGYDLAVIPVPSRRKRARVALSLTVEEARERAARFIAPWL